MIAFKKKLNYEDISNMGMIRDIVCVIFVQNSLALKLGLINIRNTSMEMDHLFEGCEQINSSREALQYHYKKTHIKKMLVFFQKQWD